MIRNTNDLIKKLKRIGEAKIEQGINFKALANSIEYNKQKKTFKEWLDFTRSALKIEEESVGA